MSLFTSRSGSTGLAGRVLVTGMVLVTAGLLVLAATASPVLAKPRNTLVAGLEASVTKPNAEYRVASTWAPVTGATAYRTRLTVAGQVVAESVVTQASWVASTAGAAGASATVRVAPVLAKRTGRAATVTTVLPDLSAPTGSYGVSRVGRVATVEQQSLADDTTAPGSIARRIAWGDGTSEPFVGNSMLHTYTADGRYHASVTLTDLAGNSHVVTLPVLVVGDEVAPLGTFTVGPQAAWARHTLVSLSQVSLSDDFSTPAGVTRLVDWRDGTAPQQWPAGETLSHVYAAEGTYAPSVELVDEAGNTSAATVLGEVVVTADSVAPTLTLTQPTSAADRVRSWERLRGTATDLDGVGVRKVAVLVVQKRASGWFSYRAGQRTWVPGGASKASAMRRADAAVVRPVADAWVVRVRDLRRGTLVVKTKATDLVGNKSGAVKGKQSLTRW